MAFDEVRKMLEQRGWVQIRQRGSHVHFRDARGRVVTVPRHGAKPVSTGVLLRILKDADIDPDELRKEVRRRGSGGHHCAVVPTILKPSGAYFHRMKFFALLLVVALSGCFFPGGHCGLHPSSGEWDAPALYEELIANPIPNAQRLPPEPGWMLPTASWATNITSVARDGQHAHFGLDALGRVTGHLRSDTGAARDDARAFLAGLTGANDTILDAWVDELLTTAHKESDGVVHCDGYECVDVDRPSSVAWQLPVAADVVGRWNALDEVDALMIFPNHARGGHWEFALSIEQVYVVFDAWQLNIDASGHAMSAGPSMGEVPESQYISHIERDLQAAGLPTDGVSRMHVGGAIC